MATAYHLESVTCPAGISSAAPLEQTLAVPQGEVERIEIVIPSGHQGLTGIALLIASAQVLPRPEGTWLIADDRVVTLPIERLPTTGRWAARLYNQDDFEHSWHLEFLIDELAVGPGFGAGLEPLPL